MIRVRNGTIIISVPLYWIEYYLLSHSPAYTTWLTVNKLEMSASSTYTAAMLLKWRQVERCFKMFFLWECLRAASHGPAVASSPCSTHILLHTNAALLSSFLDLSWDGSLLRLYTAPKRLWSSGARVLLGRLIHVVWCSWRCWFWAACLHSIFWTVQYFSHIFLNFLHHNGRSLIRHLESRVQVAADLE